MEVDGVEDGEINGVPGMRTISPKNGIEWGANKENTSNYSDYEPRRKRLREFFKDPDAPTDTYYSLRSPPPINARPIDSYVPEYSNRLEWLRVIQLRERKERSRNRDEQYSSERQTDESTPKSGSEIISDEHSSSFNSMYSSGPTLLDENSQDIIWPAWLDPAGKLSASITPIPEFQTFIEEKKRIRLKQIEEMKAQLGEALEPVDITSLKTSKKVLSGDGWRRQKDGTRTPSVFWRFLKENNAQPTDPRGPEYHLVSL